MSGGSMNYFYRKLLWECDFDETTPMREAFSRHLLKVAAALKAVEWVDSGDLGPGDEDEPIAEVLGSTNRAQRMRDAGYTRRPTLREMSEPEQEPVAWMTPGQDLHLNNGEWQSLSEEEIIDAVRESDLDWQQGWTLEDSEPNRYTQLTRAIEAKLKEINT